MSCLIIKVGDKSTHPDGEVISALSHRRVMQAHAYHLCHLDRAGFNRHRLRSVTSLAHDLRSAVYQYAFIQIGENEVLRHDLKTGRQETFGSIPKIVDGQTQHIHVGEFVARRLQHRRHAIFGRPGECIWYGGSVDHSEATLQLLWDRLTLKTGVTCPTWWPAGRKELAYHLVLPVERLSDADAAALQGNRLPWRQLVPYDLIRRIEDKRQSVNLYRLGYVASLRRVARRAA